MIARGVPPEFVSMATKKIAAINAAYEAVTKERHALIRERLAHQVTYMGRA
jgi:DnaJ like chaperone protein